MDNDTWTFDGYASPEQFQQVLFGISNRDLAVHHLTITNVGSLDPNNPNRTAFDLDWITFETEYEGPGGPIGAEITQATFDDNHPRFEYIPPSAWTAGTHTAGFLNETSSTTKSTSATVEFTFDGDAIALYGSVGSDHGEYTVLVDGEHSVTLSSFSNISETQQVLYYAHRLGAGTHTLTVENNPGGSGGSVFSLDYATSWTARGGSGGGDGGIA